MLPFDSLREDRLSSMLATALGEKASELLCDQSIAEIMLNPDGKLWIDRLGEGRSFTGHYMLPADAERVILIVASSTGLVCNRESPLLSAELPLTGARFQGILPPVTISPIFSIRRRAIKVFSLAEYVEQGSLSQSAACAIEEAIQSRKNILIAGGTGSGKTTFANAILQCIAQTNDRIVVIEDTQELQCAAKDSICLRARDGVTSMTDLLRATMRLRPDRIIIGEVRGPEALTLLKAWNTGHPGGCATVHADSAAKSLTRLEQLVQEAGVRNARTLIADAVNLIVYIEKTNTGRAVKEVTQVVGVEGEKYLLQKLAA